MWSAGLGRRRTAGYTIDERPACNKGRAWLAATLAAHPDMIPDLRAYAVYALATTGGAPKDALDKTWDSRNKLSDEGLALAGLALDAAGDGRAQRGGAAAREEGQVPTSMPTGKATTTACSITGTTLRRRPRRLR